MSKIAKSIIFDIADNHGAAQYVGVRAIEFYLGLVRADLPNTGYFDSYATTFLNSDYGPDHAFLTGESKTGTSAYRNFLSAGAITNQRLIIVLNDPVEFDSIVVNNCHAYGGSRDIGFNNVKITISTDAITDTTYNAAVANSEVIFDDAFAIHIVGDVVDDQVLQLNFINCPALASAADLAGVVSIAVGVPALSLVSSLSSAVLPGYFLDPPAFDVSAGLAAVVGIQLAPPSLASSSTLIGGVFDTLELVALAGLSGLGADLQNGLASPAFLTSGSLAVSGVFIGYPVTLGNPFEAVAALAADLTLALDLPALDSPASLMATPTRQITVAGFDSSGTLDAGPQVTFSYPDPVTLFLFTLTGAGDGLADVLIPISSFQLVHRAGKPSYLSVTIPDDSYNQQIADRSNGELVVRMARQHQGAIYHSEEIVRADLEEIRPDGGGQRKSITLTGHGLASYGVQAVEIPLVNISYRVGAPGSRRFRLGLPDIFLRPGNTANYGADSILIDRITYTVGAGQTTMEVAE